MQTNNSENVNANGGSRSLHAVVGATTVTVAPDPTNDALLQGQPKPTGEQVLWVLAHFADLWMADNQQGYGFIMQRMYGYPSSEKIAAISAGQCLANVINCAKECPRCKREYAACYV